MKSLKLLLLLPLLFVSCADIEESGCLPDDNLVVKFSLKDKNGVEIFPSTVNNVEFFLFDPSGAEVSRKSVSQAKLNLFKGVKLDAAAGTYSIICWANFDDASKQMVVPTRASYPSVANYHVSQPIPIAGGTYTDGSALYYATKGSAPMEVVIPFPSTGVTEVTVEFGHAHVKLKVSVKDYLLGGTAAPLTVEITDIVPNYGFDLSPFGTPLNFSKVATSISATDFDAVFNVPLFKVTTTMQVRITDNTGALITPAINIADLIPPGVNLDEVVELPILIKFNNGLDVDVIIDLPGWDEEPITGEA